MLNEIVNEPVGAAIDVHVIWMPMVGGDCLEAAQRTGALFPSESVHQYYDADRLLGLALRRTVFATCLNEARKTVDPGHPLYETIVEWSGRPPEDSPLWDAVLFYPPGVEWIDEIPAPAFWSKQVGYFGTARKDVTGIFFRDACNRPPEDSDWGLEIRRSVQRLQAAGRSVTAAP